MDAIHEPSGGGGDCLDRFPVEGIRAFVPCRARDGCGEVVVKQASTKLVCGCVEAACGAAYNPPRERSTPGGGSGPGPLPTRVVPAASRLQRSSTMPCQRRADRHCKAVRGP